MKVDLAAMADHASSGEGGKLTVVGIFDRINVKSFPAAHPSMAFVVRTKAEYEDRESDHPLHVTLETPDGNKIVDLDGKITIGSLEPGMSSYQNTVINLNNVPLEEPGTYVWRVRIDGKQEDEKTLHVAKA